MNKLIIAPKVEHQLSRFDMSVRRRIAEGIGTLLDDDLISDIEKMFIDKKPCA